MRRGDEEDLRIRRATEAMVRAALSERECVDGMRDSFGYFRARYFLKSVGSDESVVLKPSGVSMSKKAGWEICGEAEDVGDVPALPGTRPGP